MPARFSNIGTASGTGEVSQRIPIDAGNFVGRRRATHIETFVDGQDADSPTGPNLVVGRIDLHLCSDQHRQHRPRHGRRRRRQRHARQHRRRLQSDASPVATRIATRPLDLGETWTYSRTNVTQAMLSGHRISNIVTASGAGEVQPRTPTTRQSTSCLVQRSTSRRTPSDGDTATRRPTSAPTATR